MAASKIRLTAHSFRQKAKRVRSFSAFTGSDWGVERTGASLSSPESETKNSLNHVSDHVLKACRLSKLLYYGQGIPNVYNW